MPGVRKNVCACFLACPKKCGFLIVNLLKSFGNLLEFVGMFWKTIENVLESVGIFHKSIEIY